MKRFCVAGGLLLSLVLLGRDAAAQTGTARGKVVDEKGQGLDATVVTLEFQGGITRKFDTKTNKKGEFTQVGLAPGNYKITATKDGYQPAALETRISLGEPTYLPDLKLLPRGAAGAGGGGGGAADKAQAELREAVDQAITLAKAGKLDEAEAIYKDLAVKNPTTPAIYYNLAVVQTQKKDIAGAEASFLKALEVKPDYTEAKTALTNLYINSNQGAKATEFAGKAAAANPQDAKAQFQVGLVAFNSGKSEEAAEAFKKAEALDPTYADTYYYLGSIAVGQNKLDECTARLEKYLSMAPPTAPNVPVAQALLAACKPKK